uniref:Histidine-rich glycoprotein-like n=1 Tax=Pundamilia nyererei TaxID=303518 RepID=A0A3B4H9J3_9CICH
MKTCVLLSLLLALGCVTINGAPVERGGMEPGSCEDASTKADAELALTKINQDRKEGYVFSLHRLSNAHTKRHGENGVVFYLNLDVVETNCSVLSKRDWKSCDIRSGNTQVYGQCKAAIFISKVHRVVRLYKYKCAIRPGRVHQSCGGCPGLTDHNHDKVQKAVTQSLEKFNQQSGLANRFALLKISRATSQVVAGSIYRVEYTIQETTCPHSTEAVTAENCPPMDCEFAHKGFCKASLFQPLFDEEQINVDCELYVPEAAKRQMMLPLLGGETDHSHNDTHSHSHDHTKSHSHHGHNRNQTDDHNHHHTHDHATGSSHRHWDHSHDHGMNHDHVHTHHAKAHNKHAVSVHIHVPDHELALDHDHKHGHLHEHEHHHHHHEHEHENTPHDDAKGTVIVLPALGQPVTLPSFPDVPAGGPGVGVTLPLKPDPQVPGQMEPAIEPFPTSVSALCPTKKGGDQGVGILFANDPMFKPAA